MVTKIRLIDVPKKLNILEEWQTCHKLKLMEINGRSLALSGLKELAKKDYSDYKKLLKNIKLQLQSTDILKDKSKIQIGKQKNQRNIIEIKATRGHSRLFAFLTEDKEIIICTHTYWKTATDKKQQNKEFNKAAQLHKLYIENKKEREK